MPRGFKRRSNNNPTTLYYQNKRSTKIQAEVKSTFEPDQKRRAVAAFKRGDKRAVISGVVGCSTRSLYNWAQNTSAINRKTRPDRKILSHPEALPTFLERAKQDPYCRTIHLAESVESKTGIKLPGHMIQNYRVP